jgi:hypothetical protein
MLAGLLQTIFTHASQHQAARQSVFVILLPNAGISLRDLSVISGIKTRRLHWHTSSILVPGTIMINT